MVRHSQIFYFDLTAIAWSWDGSYLACSDDTGEIFLIEAESLHILDHLPSKFKKDVAPHPIIELISISPDSKLITLVGTVFSHI
jgi:hypothetical protein